MKHEIFIMVPALEDSCVKIREPQELSQKLSAMQKDGCEQLQIITDYDLTISKHHVNGMLSQSSFGLLKNCKGFAQVMEQSNILREKYYPIEFNPNLSRAEKTPHMCKWYKECDKLYDGVILHPSEIEESVRDSKPPAVLRDGAVEFFRALYERKIPVLVLSAGLGDAIVAVLNNYGLKESEYFKLISNFLKIENGVIRGFGNHENGQYIHPYNKSGLGCSDYFKSKVVSGRNNVILMGDSIGDANMDDGVPQVQNVLKIGFLYGTPEYIEQSITKYLEHFDIVLIDDQTMKVPQAIFDFINK